MQKPSRRTATLVASALGALVLALPGQSFADSYPRQAYSDYNRSYYGDNAGQLRRDWRGTRHATARVRAAIHRDQRIIREARRAMYEARRRHDWRDYRHYQRELEQAKEALRHHQAQLEYARRDRDYERHAFNR